MYALFPTLVLWRILALFLCRMFVGGLFVFRATWGPTVLEKGVKDAAAAKLRRWKSSGLAGKAERTTGLCPKPR